MNIMVCLKCKRFMWIETEPLGKIYYLDSGCITERHSVSCRLITDDDKW